MSSPPRGEHDDAQTGVPLTAWLGEIMTPSGLPSSVLVRAIATFSQPADRIVTIDAPPGISHAADHLHRRLHLIFRPADGGLAVSDGGGLPRHTAGLVIDYQPAMIDSTGDVFPDPFLADYIRAGGMLRPGGILLVVIAPGNPQCDGLARTVTAARGAGLRYLQHIVVLTATVTDDRLTRPPAGIPADGRLLTPAHTDIAVFTTPGGRHG
ncbi:hypothetical protein [Frankia sp. Cj3]|uniref:hypothetical protein n=1 Tax=Frankia sp. Cj3 TaxID=2880976 RepID=UPI001EF5B6AC|nr:hypothetical protein [Frankia sp. Cj3]